MIDYLNYEGYDIPSDTYGSDAEYRNNVISSLEDEAAKILYKLVNLEIWFRGANTPAPIFEVDYSIDKLDNLYFLEYNKLVKEYEYELQVFLNTIKAIDKDNALKLFQDSMRDQRSIDDPEYRPIKKFTDSYNLRESMEFARDEHQSATRNSYTDGGGGNDWSDYSDCN